MRRSQIVLIVDSPTGGCFSMKTWAVPRCDAGLANTALGARCGVSLTLDGGREQAASNNNGRRNGIGRRATPADPAIDFVVVRVP